MLRCPYFDDWIDAVRSSLKFCTSLVGNMEGVHGPDDADVTKSHDKLTSVNFTCRTTVVGVQPVQPRAAAIRKVHPYLLSHLRTMNSSRHIFFFQSSWPFLMSLRDKASFCEDEVTRTDTTSVWIFQQTTLQCVISSNNRNLMGVKYLVVPVECRRPSDSCHPGDYIGTLSLSSWDWLPKGRWEIVLARYVVRFSGHL